ncbi:hypothetical protein Syun_000991 [Stephania yunnanensis]|uniref:Uncharacterized protein n=1 Tax=Stephania yunnanensis TaxID=152371 RepID=A0AAP0QAF8_9MAGN
MISSVLIGLDRDYLRITTFLQGRSELEWQELYSTLLGFEETLDQYNVTQGLNSLAIQDSQSVNADEVKGSGSKPNFNSNNFTSQNRNNNDTGNRGSGGSRVEVVVLVAEEVFAHRSYSKPTYQICGKFGHFATVCYYKADMKYMGTQNGNFQQQQTRLSNPTPPTPSSFFTASETGQEMDCGTWTVVLPHMSLEILLIW